MSLRIASPFHGTYVYRIENDSGAGVYKHQSHMFHGGAPKGKLIDEVRPVPITDFVKNTTPESEGVEYFYGFPSIYSLFSWFDPVTLLGFKENGFDVYRYSIDSSYNNILSDSRRQVKFVRTPATMASRKKLDLSTQGGMVIEPYELRDLSTMEDFINIEYIKVTGEKNEVIRAAYETSNHKSSDILFKSIFLLSRSRPVVRQIEGLETFLNWLDSFKRFLEDHKNQSRTFHRIFPNFSGIESNITACIDELKTGLSEGKDNWNWHEITRKYALYNIADEISGVYFVVSEKENDVISLVAPNYSYV